ncbi:MAG: hypothetical protein ILP22_03050 [Oscillospiraceae bacterium]|nr:hypothetical protein [Oscillospiraceae bacterium]
MYSVEMKNAVSSAQSCIDMCCGPQNVAVKTAEYISAFAKYLDVLDPSGIDFTKTGFFAGIRIKKYWELFAEHYSKVQTITGELKKNRLIAENTLTTLKRELGTYQTALDSFMAGFSENADSELLDQKMVALNMKGILENTVAEYSALTERLSGITTTAADVFTNAVLIARVNYQINLTGGEQISGVSGKADIAGFRSGFSRLYSMCR